MATLATADEERDHEDPELQAALLLSLNQRQPTGTPAQMCAISPEVPEEARALLRRILGNVVSVAAHGSGNGGGEGGRDARVRRLRTTNPKVQAVWGVPLALAVLEQAGFVPEPAVRGGEADHVHLPAAEGVARARQALQELAPPLLASPPQSTSPPAAASTMANAGVSSPPPLAPRRRPLAERGSACALCARSVAPHACPPRGSMFMRARAAWEGVQCDSCYLEGRPWHVVCGQCYNDQQTQGGAGEHAAHLWSPIGYGVAEDLECAAGGGGAGSGRRAAPPPPGRPGGRPGRR